jgi:hypothetical protein
VGLQISGSQRADIRTYVFGAIYNLHNLSDTNGTYLGASEALAVAERPTRLSLKNKHGW